MDRVPPNRSLILLAVLLGLVILGPDWPARATELICGESVDRMNVREVLVDMDALKHPLHSCCFCYHGRTAALEVEVDFFCRRLGPSQTLLDLLALRGEYRPSFGFVIRCLPALVRLHLRTARDNRFPRGVVRGRGESPA